MYSYIIMMLTATNTTGLFGIRSEDFAIVQICFQEPLSFEMRNYAKINNTEEGIL